MKTVKKIISLLRPSAIFKFYNNFIDCRYRLGHWWVAEMLLNVQSKSSSKVR